MSALYFDSDKLVVTSIMVFPTSNVS